MVNEEPDDAPAGTVRVTTQTFVYDCPSCHDTFEAPVVRGFGEHLGMRSLGLGTLAVWSNTYTNPNPVNAELEPILRRINLYAGASSARQGTLGQAAMSWVADRDADGSRFVPGAKPRCPACTAVPEQYHGTNHHRPQFVPVVTFRMWGALPESDRQKLVRQAVIDSYSH